MNPRVDIPQRLLHGAVALNPAKRRQTLGADHNGEMAFAGAVITGMAGVFVALIHHIQPVGGKSRFKSLTNFTFDRHFLSLPLHLACDFFKVDALSRKGLKMSTRPPFEFDLRVSTDKSKRKTVRRGTMSGASEAANRPCDFPDCREKAAYRAPKSPDHLNEYFWFCRDHIREYNLKWNFFGTATDEEFQKLLDKDRLWERETVPFSRKDDGRAWARLGVNDPLAILGEKATQNPGKALSQATRKLPSTERKALDILDARDTWTKSEIRKQYKGLVKDLHPDMNGGDRSDEDRLQEVVWAWDQIKDSRYFKE